MYIKIMLLLFFLIIIFANVINALKNYNPYHYYEIIAFNAYERKSLFKLNFRDPTVTFLTEVSNDASIPIEVIVHPCCTTTFEKWLKDLGVEYKELPWSMDDLYRSISTENVTHNEIGTNFYSLSSIYSEIEMLTKKYSSMISKQVIGRSIAKRDIIVVKISTGHRKQSVFIEAGEQGKEWLTSTIVMEIIDLTINNNKIMQSLLNDYDFHLLPVLNPDGYNHAFKEDIFWTKNRRKVLINTKCNNGNKSNVGVHIDRNWNINHGKREIDRSCDSMYEAEPAALSAYINTIASNMMAFINLKGYGQIVMVPDVRKKQDIKNFPVAMEILKIALNAYNDTFGVKYKFTKTSKVIYNNTGGVADWVKYHHNIPLVYTFQLSKTRRYSFHSISEIEDVTSQFVFILKEILVLGRDIYSPLFNNCSSNCLHLFEICLINIIWLLQ